MSSATPRMPRPSLRPGVVLAPVLVVGALLVVWQLGTSLTGTSVTVLPSPATILTQADWPAIGAATMSTIGSVLAGFALGNLVGFALALLVSASRPLADIIYPGAVMVRSIPIVALAPFITLFFGRGVLSAVVVGALIVFFPTLVNTIVGLRSVPQEALELGHVFNAGPVFQYVRVRIPFAMPWFVSALRISAPGAVLGVMTAEWVIGGAGLGRLVVQSWLGLDIPTMWGAVVLSAVVAWALFSVVSLAERLFLGWAVRT
ncbi:ABC transporter permease [Leifsonia sp. AG29]|uniref:ABC transporter permease n=1 Tax=Leifsonia sp. AG29 TaxID=2598860 RepID=UPI00131C67A3|nr:ABC transporter permease [Leifsonia sp. AG29]